jgi:hypothetical protein
MKKSSVSQIGNSSWLGWHERENTQPNTHANIPHGHTTLEATQRRPLPWPNNLLCYPLIRHDTVGHVLAFSAGKIRM